MNYNLYIEEYYGAGNKLIITSEEVEVIIESLSNSGFLKNSNEYYYLKGNIKFKFAIFSNNYKGSPDSLWNYCLEHNFYEDCTTPPTGGVVVTPKFLKLFGENCTSDFVKNKLMAF